MSNSVLRRKAAATREGQEAVQLSPRRALRLALAQTAEVDLTFPMMVSSIERLRADHGALMQLIDPSGLMICIEAPDGTRGAVMLDLQLITALVECQTIGMVLSRPAQSRRTTRTDAAVSMPLIDGTLLRFEAALRNADAFDWVSGFKFSQWIGEKRSLGVALTAVNYDLFKVVLEIGEEGRVGEVMIALPVPKRKEALIVAPKARGGESFRARVMKAETTLTAVLCRHPLALKKVTALKPGDVLPIPSNAFSDISLVSGRGRSKVIARGALGQSRGQRAFRLIDAATPIAATWPESLQERPRKIDMADGGLVDAPKAPRPSVDATGPMSAPSAAFQPSAAPPSATPQPALQSGPQAAPQSGLPQSDALSSAPLTHPVAKQTPQIAQDTEALLSELGLGLSDSDRQIPRSVTGSG